MNAISKPSADELAPLLAEATENGRVSEDAWRTKLLTSFANMVKKHPLSYRAFGPYWWLLKSMFVECGIVRFGTTIDAEWLEATTYGDDTLNLLAVYAYYSHSFETGLQRSNTHTIPLDDGEALHFVLADDEVEIMVFEA